MILTPDTITPVWYEPPEAARAGFYRSDGTRIPGVGRIIREVESEPAKPGLPAWKLPDILARGGRVHVFTEYADLGVEMPWHEMEQDEVPFVEAYCSFLEEVKPITMAREEKVLDPFGYWWGYIDRRFLLQDSRRAVVDIKTGDKVYERNFLQVAAYRMSYPDHVGALLLLTRKGKWKWIESETPERDVQEIYAQAVEYRRRERLGRLTADEL